jgi:hypothetical protein
MKKELPIYKLTINPSDEDSTEVNFVALVDEPAIMKTWMAFNKSKQLFKGDKEKRMITGPLMVADLPIPRRDASGKEYYVVFDSQTIEQIALKFFRKGYHKNVNLMHEASAKVDGVYMFESWITNSELGKGVPKGFDELPDGSWFGTFKVDNMEVWETFIKTGEFKGFSVEGIFEHNLETTEREDVIQDVIDAIMSIVK